MISTQRVATCSFRKAVIRRSGSLTNQTRAFRGSTAIRSFWNPFAQTKTAESKMGNKPSANVHGRSGWSPSPSNDVPRTYSKSGYDITPVTHEQRKELAEGLTQFQKNIVLGSGTERAFTGQTVNGYPHDNKQKGLYVSALGDLPLFSSSTKFNSGTGWPSFYAPIDPAHIIEVTDFLIPFMPRVEVIDARTGAHLGHVFDDGPRPTGKRYCINAAALKFIPEGEPLPSGAKPVDSAQ